MNIFTHCTWSHFVSSQLPLYPLLTNINTNTIPSFTMQLPLRHATLMSILWSTWYGTALGRAIPRSEESSLITVDGVTGVASTVVPLLDGGAPIQKRGTGKGALPQQPQGLNNQAQTRAKSGGKGLQATNSRTRLCRRVDGAESCSSGSSLSESPIKFELAEKPMDIDLVDESVLYQERLRAASLAYNQGTRPKNTYTVAPNPASKQYQVTPQNEAPQEAYTRQPQVNNEWKRFDILNSQASGQVVQRTYIHPASGTLVNSFSKAAHDTRPTAQRLRASALSAYSFAPTGAPGVALKVVFRDQISDSPTTSSGPNALVRDTIRAINMAIKGMGHTGSGPLTLRSSVEKEKFYRDLILSTNHGRHTINMLYDHPQNMGGGMVIGNVVVHPPKKDASVGSSAGSGSPRSADGKPISPNSRGSPTFKPSSPSSRESAAFKPGSPGAASGSSNGLTAPCLEFQIIKAV